MRPRRERRKPNSEDTGLLLLAAGAVASGGLFNKFRDLVESKNNKSQRAFKHRVYQTLYPFSQSTVAFYKNCNGQSPADLACRYHQIKEEMKIHDWANGKIKMRGRLVSPRCRFNANSKCYEITNGLNGFVVEEMKIHDWANGKIKMGGRLVSPRCRFNANSKCYEITNELNGFVVENDVGEVNALCPSTKSDPGPIPAADLTGLELRKWIEKSIQDDKNYNITIDTLRKEFGVFDIDNIDKIARWKAKARKAFTNKNTTGKRETVTPKEIAAEKNQIISMCEWFSRLEDEIDEIAGWKAKALLAFANNNTTGKRETVTPKEIAAEENQIYSMYDCFSRLEVEIDAQKNGGGWRRE